MKRTDGYGTGGGMGYNADGKPTADGGDARAKRAEELRRLIERHDRLYYIENRPEISDREYDELYAELKRLEEEDPSLIVPDSPTQRVGAKLSGKDAVRSEPHRSPMLSLDNTYSEGELREFDARVRRFLGLGSGEKIEYAVEMKIDGAAVSLWYERGLLVKGLTRGDGENGENITHNLRTIRDVPLRLRPEGGAAVPEFLEVRGEVYMPRAEFERLLCKQEEEGEAPFANPRNAAAGTLKQLDPKIVASRRLRMFVHTPGERSGARWRTHLEFLEGMASLGLRVNPHRRLCKDIGKVIETIAEWDDIRRSLDYDTDGCVVKVNDFQMQEALGFTAKAPRFAIAYKYKAEEARTRIIAIDVQVGKTGVLTPVARLEPVFLAGTTIENASLHNEDEIRRKDIRIGDIVYISKAGEIIPQVVRVEKGERTGAEREFRMPDRCPACGGRIERREGEVARRCVNQRCPGRYRARILYFASRHCMDIQGLGPALIDRLISEGLLRDPADLYSLKADAIESLEFEGEDKLKRRLGRKNADKLIAAIEESKSRGLARVLAALNIPHVGERKAELLAERFGGMDALRKASAEDLMKVESIGEVVARSVLDFFADPGEAALVDRLAAAGVCMRSSAKPAAPIADGSNPFAGKTFVLTGTLSGYTREQAEALIRERGGRCTGSVSSKTDFVLAGKEPGSKLDKAKKLGIRIVGEAEFEEMLGKRKGETTDS